MRSDLLKISVSADSWVACAQESIWYPTPLGPGANVGDAVLSAQLISWGMIGSQV